MRAEALLQLVAVVVVILERLQARDSPVPLESGRRRRHRPVRPPERWAALRRIRGARRARGESPLQARLGVATPRQ